MYRLSEWLINGSNIQHFSDAFFFLIIGVDLKTPIIIIMRLRTVLGQIVRSYIPALIIPHFDTKILTSWLPIISFSWSLSKAVNTSLKFPRAKSNIVSVLHSSKNNKKKKTKTFDFQLHKAEEKQMCVFTLTLWNDSHVSPAPLERKSNLFSYIKILRSNPALPPSLFCSLLLPLSAQVFHSDQPERWPSRIQNKQRWPECVLFLSLSVCVCVCVCVCVWPVLWPMDNSGEGRVGGSVGFRVAVRVWELRGGATQIRLWRPSINEVITSLRPGPRPLPGRGQPRLTTNTVESNQLTHQCQEQPHNRGGNLRKPHVTEEWSLSGGCGRFGIPAAHFLSFSLCLG